MTFAVGFIQGGEREREIKPEYLVGSFEIERERDRAWRFSWQLSSALMFLSQRDR